MCEQRIRALPNSPVGPHGCADEVACMDISAWDTSTWASVISAVVTIGAVLAIAWFEWYRRPRLRLRPSKDQPTQEWIHLAVTSDKPRWWFLPRDMALDCVARVSFLDPTTRQPLTGPDYVRGFSAHWVGRPEPQAYYDIPNVIIRNIGFWDEAEIDVLRRLPNGTAYAADPWLVYAWPPTATPEWEERRLKQREYIARVELFVGNGWRTTQDFRLRLPPGMGQVVWSRSTLSVGSVPPDSHVDVSACDSGPHSSTQ